MALTVRCRRLDGWQGDRTRDRRKAPYTARWDTILADLVAELEHLGARDVVVGIDVAESDIRIDGWPKGGRAVPPPVVLTFDSKVGSLRFQCDRWSTYQHNLRAISLTLTRLRLVDEGGVARSGEQYRGWNAIGSGASAATPMAGAMTVEQAALLLLDGDGGATVGDVIRDPWIAQTCFRSAAKRHHPDAGGDPAHFRLLTEARDLIEKNIGHAPRTKKRGKR